MRWILVPFVFFSLSLQAQCKSYRLNGRGDTLNCIDQKDRKQGKWFIRYESLRGEPGYEEEGLYKDDKKEGLWRLYTLMGDLIGVESYRWGNKDGISQYYTINGLSREESWKATNPSNPYDTIEVPDPIDPYKVEMKVIKLEGSSTKHGIWKYYQGGALMKTENYFLGKIVEPNMAIGGTQPVVSDTTVSKKKETTKPKEVEAFEKKNKKKKIVVRDGRTGY